MMYDITWSDVSDSAKLYTMPRLVGDPELDGANLDRSSPLKRVAELKTPVLLVHGWVDRHVPYEHARRFADLATRAGVKVEEVTDPKEGPGGSNPDDHADHLRRVEGFLAKSLKQAP